VNEDNRVIAFRTCSDERRLYARDDEPMPEVSFRRLRRFAHDQIPWLSDWPAT
jgi:hypothetical protein